MNVALIPNYTSWMNSHETEVSTAGKMALHILASAHKRYLRSILSSQHTQFLSSVLLACQRSGQGHTSQSLTVHSRGFNSKGYKNFGHQKKDSPSLLRICWASILFLGMSPMVIDYAGLYNYFSRKFSSLMKKTLPSVEAKAIKQESMDKTNKTELEATSDTEKKSKKETINFRDRKIVEYENRIRQYSTPDKVFRYFATRKVHYPSGDSEIYMTPDDFLRSLTPGMKQPEGLGLDHFETVDFKMVKNYREEFGLPKTSIFNRLGRFGLISFSDYIFLLTVLSTSRRHFEIAFRMFDLNGDGDVDVDEFQKVANLTRQQTSVGLRHRDHSVTGNTFKGVNTALSKYFFGNHGDKKLTIDKFLDFQEQLRKEILTLEFNRKKNEDGKITEVDFSEMLLIYANYPEKIKLRTKKRIRKAFKESGKGISLEDYLNFFHFLSNINDVDTALTFYHVAGAAIDKATMKHVARIVANVNLSDHLMDVVFDVFDVNQDGHLSNREFVAVMKNRLLRGLEKPKDTGFFKFLSSVVKCARECKPSLPEF
ncbi:calcium uptake protein 1 homolog, mitochondrial-like isoform X2 [Artemia franciscana]|uniref:calcium uptake protein 1 homolog, mitochondrial-like isoform X2 n=2 Tax=Artemia franciscana TaxID=6661 RepID=UPI0032D9F501